jgi:hypothetical protein
MSHDSPTFPKAACAKPMWWRVETVDGKPELLLIHVEIEAEHRKDFETR